MTVNRSNIRASLFSLIAFTAWAIGDAFIKASSERLSILHRGFVVTLFTSLTLLLIYAVRGDLRKLKPVVVRVHLLRGVANLINLLFVVFALEVLPLASFYLIAFLSPLIITAIGAKVLREKVATGVWLALLAGFFGVIVAVRPTQFDAASWPLSGIGAMFLANFALTFYVITIKFGGDRESSEALAFYPEFIATIGFLLLMICKGGITMDAVGVLYAGLAGLCCGSAVWMLTLAYRLAANAYVAPLHYTQIVTGGVIGYTVWHEQVGLPLAAGAAIIIAAGLYVVWHGAGTKEGH